MWLNEFDRHAAQWLRNLMDAGELPRGTIDDRDIREVKGSDLEGITEAHWFAGIGGWPLALRWAGWPAGKEVWTGSCPCQPFSTAGKRLGTIDARHLLVDGLPFKLADGRTCEGVSRAQALKGIGNAIVPQCAVLFVRAFLECESVSAMQQPGGE